MSFLSKAYRGVGAESKQALFIRGLTLKTSESISIVIEIHILIGMKNS